MIDWDWCGKQFDGAQELLNALSNTLDALNRDDIDLSGVEATSVDGERLNMNHMRAAVVARNIELIAAVFQCIAVDEPTLKRVK